MSRYISEIRSVKRMLTQPLRKIAARDCPAYPVHVFHHIPKCAGNSVIKVLDDWFISLYDYRKGRTHRYPARIKLEKVNSAYCICGHFETEGYYLLQRYPQLADSNRYRLFSFVRDPLQLRISLYFYESRFNNDRGSLEDNLFSHRNYLAKRFPATESNYRDVVERYIFIGIVEKLQDSLDQLARLCDRPKVKIRHINSGTYNRNPEQVGLSHELQQRFREENALDYKIYDLCKNRFERLLLEQNRT